MKKTVSIVIMVLLVGIGGYLFINRPFSSTPQQTTALDSFAKCLAKKKIIMYGAEWCKHCQNEKKAFGSSVQYVSYVECPKNTKVCLDKKVTGYPSWIFPDGKRLEGEQGLETLAKESKCSLPKEVTSNK